MYVLFCVFEHSQELLILGHSWCSQDLSGESTWQSINSCWQPGIQHVQVAWQLELCCIILVRSTTVDALVCAYTVAEYALHCQCSVKHCIIKIDRHEQPFLLNLCLSRIGSFVCTEAACCTVFCLIQCVGAALARVV